MNETNWINDVEENGPTFYKRYVDDIFAVFKDENEANSFFDHINRQHPNIQFTKENSENGKLPFLDILINNLEEFDTTVYHKKTYTGLLLNFKSFTPFQYKIRLIQTLLDRTYKICSSRNIFDIECKKLTKTFLKNLYPKRLIDRCIKRYLDNKNKPVSQIETKVIRYVTLPYIGHFSDFAKSKINKLVKEFCKKELEIKLVFTTCKLKSYFSNKDRLPKEFTSFVIYKFNCAGCNSSYVGRTHCHFDTRCEQHLKTDHNSSIYKHINSNNNCKKSNKNSFKIVDRGNTDYTLAIKEGMHIKWNEPNLNSQKKHMILKLLL